MRFIWILDKEPAMPESMWLHWPPSVATAAPTTCSEWCRTAIHPSGRSRSLAAVWVGDATGRSSELSQLMLPTFMMKLPLFSPAKRSIGSQPGAPSAGMQPVHHTFYFCLTQRTEQLNTECRPKVSLVLPVLPDGTCR